MTYVPRIGGGKVGGAFALAIAGGLFVAVLAQAAIVDHGDLTSNETQCTSVVNNRTVSSDQDGDGDGDWASVNVQVDVSITEFSTKEDRWKVHIDIAWTSWPNGPLGPDVQPGQTPGNKAKDDTHADVRNSWNSWGYGLKPDTNWVAANFLYDGVYSAEVTAFIERAEREWDSGDVFAVQCNPSDSGILTLTWIAPTDPDPGSEIIIV